MRWEDIDLVGRLWTIPATFSKNGVCHTVPLNPQAQSILRDLSEWQATRLAEINAGRKKKKLSLKEPSEWVFPSPRGDDEPFQWEQRATNRVRRRSGVDFRPHDLRRTAATLLTTYEYADRFLLKRILNHVDRDITGVYDRNKYDAAKRVALDRWGRRLDAILKGKEKEANIATFKPASGRRS